MKPIIEKMQPYDGDGYLCYIPGDTEGPCGFGETPQAARESWERGEDIAKAAWNKWMG